MKLSDNAKTIVEARYFPTESWEDGCARVGKSIGEDQHYQDIFGDMIYNQLFIPAGRILKNAGGTRGSMFNCYALPIGDSIKEIGKFYMESNILWANEGGVGCDFSPLRPEGDTIQGGPGVSSGLVSFLKASDGTADVIKAAGARRAAGLAGCSIEHPEVKKFIDAKTVDGDISNYNISVIINNEFLQAVEADGMWMFKFNQKAYNEVPARSLWWHILSNMIRCGEPGLLNSSNFYKNNSYYFDPVRITNPSLRKGTKILTLEGIFPIEELENKTFFTPNINGEDSLAKCFLSGKNKQLYKITLEGNHEIYATKEHKWPVIKKDKWHYNQFDLHKTTTTNLKSGDYLPQPSFKEGLNYGTEGSYEDGFVIGWNISDGWLSDNDRPLQIGFIVSNEDTKFGIDTIISNKLKKLGWTGSFRNVRNNKETNISNNKVREFFNYFKVNKKETGIPKSIWNISSESFRKGFIDAMFSADGSVSNNVITLTTSYKQIANDISDLLGFYGIHSAIYHTTIHGGTFPNGKSYDKIYHRYDVKIRRQSSIYKFYKIFTLTHKKKQNKIKDLVESFNLIAPKNAVKIISIEATDLYEDVWDIQVKDNIHCFDLAHVLTGNCGEAVLEPYGMCCLGSLVLPNFVANVNTNWKKLEETIRHGIRFLDSVIDKNIYILDNNKLKAQSSRRIGLGVMGLAEYLFAKQLRYGSPEAINETERLMKFIRNVSYDASADLAIEKGAFPKFDPIEYGKASFIRKLPVSLRRKIKNNGIRNVTTMSMAPTGTISLVADTTSGIEPLFSKAYRRDDRVGSRVYIHPLYQSLIKKELPDWYVDVGDLKPQDHLEMQSVVQRYTDGAVSKTINLSAGTKIEQLDEWLLEYIKDLKGVTVYVDGSRGNQILNRLDHEAVVEYIGSAETTMVDEDVNCANGSCEL